ncbi:hypothetical protein [Oceanobacter antarcticus]|uniref:Uncharacterized protein n=1 Tax=Oceanobacter antarcticus TaxID=3133425 RepID=A0ABW8NJ11_9GAMM
MLLTTYKETGRLFYSNFLEATSESGLLAYRGDLVIVAGEIGDDKGHTLPPKEIMREAVILADDKIHMFVGALDKMASIPGLVDFYEGDFAPDMKAVLFVVNLKSPVQVDINGINFVLIPMVQGVPWNELMEELALEKSDFKGQKPAAKLETMYAELKGYKPQKYPLTSLEEAMTMTNSAVREIHGAL